MLAYIQSRSVANAHAITKHVLLEEEKNGAKGGDSKEKEVRSRKMMYSRE